MCVRPHRVRSGHRGERSSDMRCGCRLRSACALQPYVSGEDRDARFIIARVYPALRRHFEARALGRRCGAAVAHQRAVGMP